jgi:hypothetical protein
MTPRTPQGEVFSPFLSNSKHSGVSEDSKSPTLGVWVSSSHWAKVGLRQWRWWFQFLIGGDKKNVTTSVSRARTDRKCNKVYPICSIRKVLLRFFLKIMLRDFITHNYVAKWQRVIAFTTKRFNAISHRFRRELHLCWAKWSLRGPLAFFECHHLGAHHLPFESNNKS